MILSDFLSFEQFRSNGKRCKGVTIKVGKRQKPRSKGLTYLEAIAILTLASAHDGGGEQPRTRAAKRWAPWLCVYTSARVGEIAHNSESRNVVDDVTRECLAAIPDTSISGRRVARELTSLIERRGKPGLIVSDNGAEFTSNAMLSWAQDHRIEWHLIAPEKPMQNGFRENFNGRRWMKVHWRVNPHDLTRVMTSP